MDETHEKVEAIITVGAIIASVFVLIVKAIERRLR